MFSAIRRGSVTAIVHRALPSSGFGGLGLERRGSATVPAGFGDVGSRR
jgi:hypothetical protein